MTDTHLAEGAIEVATGVPFSIIKGLATFFGLETNAAHVQKLTVFEYENFVFDTLLDHKRRLDAVETRLHRHSWSAEEILAEHGRKLAQLQALFGQWAERLGDHGARPSDLAVVLEAGFRVWKRCADPHKRELLGKALRNSFDPKLYQEGLTLRFMALLADLTYGDLHALARAGENEQVGIRAEAGPPPDKRRPKLPLEPAERGTLAADHVKRLDDHGLIRERTFEYGNAQGGTTNFTTVVPTELGARLLAFVNERDEASSAG